jgi:hypothetical protein
MILSTRAIVGGALASVFPSHPVVVIAAGFASHFAIDAIPHWDYPLRSISTGPGAHNQFGAAVRREGLTLLLGWHLQFSHVWNGRGRVLGALGGNVARPVAICAQPVPTRSTELATKIPHLDSHKTPTGLEDGHEFANCVCYCGDRTGGRDALTLSLVSRARSTGRDAKRNRPFAEEPVCGRCVPFDSPPKASHSAG